WVKNGLAVGSGYSYTYNPADGDIIYNTLLSNYRCRDTNRVFSNNITMTVDSAIVPVVTITASPGTSIGIGVSDTLTANVTDGGTAPTYKWYLNNVAVAGATNATFIRNTFINGDSVSVKVTRNDACGLSTFNAVHI